MINIPNTANEFYAVKSNVLSIIHIRKYTNKDMKFFITNDYIVFYKNDFKNLDSAQLLFLLECYYRDNYDDKYIKSLINIIETNKRYLLNMENLNWELKKYFKPMKLADFNNGKVLEIAHNNDWNWV